MRKQWYNNRYVIILLHVAAWAVVFMTPYFLRPDLPAVKTMKMLSFFTWANILQYIFLAAIFYFNAYWLIPKLLNRKKYLLYTLSVVLILVAGYLFSFGRMKYFRGPVERGLVVGFEGRELMKSDMPLPPRNVHFRVQSAIFPSFFSLLFILAVSNAYRFFLDKIRADRLQQQRQTEHLKSELSFLRSQISPHFIFNVLNSAVSLARTQPVQVEPTLIKLSGLMRYMLYDADDTKVALNQEIEYLESYIELQKLRFGELVNIEFSKSGVLFGYAVEPLLLIPFVENAFKHGLGKVTDPYIHIKLIEEQGALYFNVKNKYNPEESTIRDKYSGIGLTNVKKRLDLLFADNYELAVVQTAEWHEIKLKIPLQ